MSSLFCSFSNNTLQKWTSGKAFYIMASAQFLQHHLRLIVLGPCLHVSVTKFQDKFASLNSPNSWDEFQIRCTDMYLIRFLQNFALFCVFLWILRIYLNFTAPRLREMSEALSFVPNNLKPIMAETFSVWTEVTDQGVGQVSVPC